MHLAEAICTAALDEYKDKGFRAYEQDDHILVLEHNHVVIALFPITVTIEALQRVCHQHLNEDIINGQAD